jgi:hypothetical protein
MVRYLLLIVSLSAFLASCCEPGHKDSQPLIIDSLFSQSHGENIDVYRMLVNNTTDTIHGFYGVYTFGIKNTGSQDDNFTLRFRLLDAGFDITKRVPAGQVVLFRTPTPQGDSSAHYDYPVLRIIAPNDTMPNMDYAYYGLSRSDTNSVLLRQLRTQDAQQTRPTVQVIYGEINNGPEACNTAPSTYTINIDRFPDR